MSKIKTCMDVHVGILEQLDHDLNKIIISNDISENYLLTAIFRGVEVNTVISADGLRNIQAAIEAILDAFPEDKDRE